MSRIILLIMVCVLVGCDQIGNKVAQTFNKGTLKGVEACLAENKSTLVSEEDIRNRCVDFHKEAIYVERTDPRHAFVTTNNHPVMRIEPAGRTWLNTSTSSIITQVEVTGKIFDKSGKEFSAKTVKKGLWIMPGEAITTVFEVRIPDMPRGIDEHCSEAPFENCKTYAISNFWGIKFTVN